ncbi:hypothetical protein L1987_56889 [Smallanthus sonchifolius]|uniref:Uncharacterized protein n=1 Tax=Smallanthus sonchifolius TaxID=185202 RepID=A0ACB9DBB0_9ASTR|nr:hypothetical protein L1987_56889 [Smallanthus sonchifolius]
MVESSNRLSSYSSRRRRELAGIETAFKLPSPLPNWPQGFASGTIDLGGLQVSQVTTFKKIWSANEGGPGNGGATFYDADSIPEGFSGLGFYAQPNNMPLFGHVLVGKDVTNDPLNPILKSPVDYTLVWSSVTQYQERCSRPTNRGVGAMGATIGGFVVQTGTGGNTLSITCLKNLKGSLVNSMPNLNQIETLIQIYSPVAHFHPNEPYLPSSVDWFFQNGALLYHKVDESNPSPIDHNGSNLPQGGSNDDTYWLDLPIDGSSKQRVKKGELQDASAYFHVKPMYGGLLTDIAIWLFYPFNGASRAKVEFINISLGNIGEVWAIGNMSH